MRPSITHVSASYTANVELYYKSKRMIEAGNFYNKHTSTVYEGSEGNFSWFTLKGSSTEKMTKQRDA